MDSFKTAKKPSPHPLHPFRVAEGSAPNGNEAAVRDHDIEAAPSMKKQRGWRHWAAALKSGHAVQRKRCGSLNRSFSYWEAAPSLRPPLPTLGKRLLEPRRPLVGAFRRSSGVRPSPAGFSFFREIALQKWSGCLAGHWGERFQAKFWD